MKLYFVFFIIFLILLPFFTLKAQPGMQDVIYLKNGSVIKGNITEHIIGSRIKIMTYGGNIFSFQYNEIEKMVKEEVPLDIQNERRTQGSFEPKVKGIIGNFALGLNTGENIGFSLIFAISYVMKYRYSLGVGMGLEYLNRQGYFPVFLNFQYSPLKGLASPYFYGMGGYSSPNTDNNRDYIGGVLGEAGMGFRAHMSSRAIFQFSVGFRYQESSFSYTNNNWPGFQRVSGKDYFRRIPVRLGITLE